MLTILYLLMPIAIPLQILLIPVIWLITGSPFIMW